MPASSFSNNWASADPEPGLWGCDSDVSFKRQCPMAEQ
jgi:hypothetical protein